MHKQTFAKTSVWYIPNMGRDVEVHYNSRAVGERKQAYNTATKKERGYFPSNAKYFLGNAIYFPSLEKLVV